MSQAHIPNAIAGSLSRQLYRFRPSVVSSGGSMGRVFSTSFRRFFDVLAAIALLVLTAPLFLARAVQARSRTGKVFERVPRIGQFRTPFPMLQFADGGRCQDLPILLNVLRGDLTLAGPRPLSFREAADVPLSDIDRFETRPGLISPYGLRAKTGIAYESETATDREFVYGQSLAGDVGLVARSIPGALLGGGKPLSAVPELDFFGVSIVNTTMEEAVDWVLDNSTRDQGETLSFVNPDCLNIAYRDDEYHEVLRAASRVLPDGIGIHLGCRLLGTSLCANVNGTDLFPRLCARAAETGHSLFLLGARPGIADATASNMKARFPGLQIAGTRDGYFTPEQEPDVIREINDSGADVLLVAFGVPRQEHWIHAHRSELRPGVCMGVGGLFDFYSGRIPRAPQWLRELGMEWSWRLMQEPGRMWRRYIIGNPVFLFRVWKQKRTVGGVSDGR